MLVKFRITFEDGSTLESHDEMWNQVADHANALPPHSKKKWKTYELITDTGQEVKVNFQNGYFFINGQRIHLADSSGFPLTDGKEPQNFPDVSKAWQIHNGMPYFPIVGRRQVKGDLVNATLYFAGWKIKRGERTIEKIVFLYPNGEFVIQ